MNRDFETFRVKRKKQVKQKLHKQKRRNIYAGRLYTKKDLPMHGHIFFLLETNMADYGAAIASTKTHKRNNKTSLSIPRIARNELFCFRRYIYRPKKNSTSRAIQGALLTIKNLEKLCIRKNS